MLIGIDLGTTNSAVAIWRDGKAELVPNGLGDVLTPSAVSMADDGSILVGMAARDRHSIRPDVTVMAFKRYMGTQHQAKLGKNSYTAEELSALVLKSLKADVEHHTGETVDEAIITVPAYFNDRQRKATKRAGELAGLKVRRLINEPTAAALAYSIHERGEKEPFLVFDLGGGTFDVSIVEMFDGIIEVRASSGDNRLGGEDFNARLIELVRARIDPEGDLAEADPSRLDPLLGAAAERTRRALSDAEEADFSIVWEGKSYAAKVTASEFEEQVKPLVGRLRDPLLRSLRDSDIRADELSDIVLVGGATRMPVIRKAITRLFGRFPNSSVHPDHAVALGAGVQAGLAARDAALDEIRLTDVCPFTLGVDTSFFDQRGNLYTGLFSPIIDRNTAIPASRVQHYGTVRNDQREVEFGIYQGESREVADNVKLGTIRVPVPPAPAGHVRIDCRFSYDVNGLLEVDVSVPATGVERNLVIVDDPESMTDVELAQRREVLAGLKIHPREAGPNAAAMARAERCYESLIGEERERLLHWILGFETALANQEPRGIETARAALLAEVDLIEGERFL